MSNVTVLRRFCLWAVLLIVSACSVGGSAAADTYVITLDPSVQREPATGRVVLFFITKHDRFWRAHKPIQAPFFVDPQPIASIAVEDYKPGDSVAIEGTMHAFPEPLDALDGKMRLQALFDADQTERAHDEGPGNVYSEELTVDVSVAKDDIVRIKLTRVVEEPKRIEHPHLKWVKFRSEILSKFYGRDVYHRAGVALPRQYHDEKWPRQQWPAIYIIPGFGGREEAAEDHAAMLLTPTVEEIAPMAVHIVLDPEAPLGHHGFVDSENNGPRATALINEFIPYLESQFRLVARPEARLITGHSSGGWSSLWLQLHYPNVFGGCWSSAPDPIDFSAFQMTDLYKDANLFVDGEGQEHPSYRRFIAAADGHVPCMTVRQEVGMEQAIDPEGRSGQQWAAWNSCFSPRNPDTGLPVSMFDPTTGAINKNVVEHWSRFDIARQVQSRWKELGPTVKSKVRLVVGDTDSYYLHRAVERFKALVERLEKEDPQPGSGYIAIIPYADHDTIIAKTFMRLNDEMRKHLQQHGLQDADPPGKGK